MQNEEKKAIKQNITKKLQFYYDCVKYIDLLGKYK